MAADRVLSGHSEEAPGWADKALALAERLGGLPVVKVQALDYRGMARCDLGDFDGLDDLRQALQLAHEIGAGEDAALLHNSLTGPLWLTDGPASALATCQAGIDFAERRGLAQTTMSLRGSSLQMLADLGRWDQVLTIADEVIVSDRAHGGGYESVAAETHKAFVWLWRGEVTAAQRLVAELLTQARDIDDLQILVPALAAAALIDRARGDLRLALNPIQELDRVAHERGGGQFYLGLYIADLVRTCMAADQQTLAVQLIEHAPTQAARHQHARFTAQAVLTETRDDLNKAAQMYEQVAEQWAQYGHAFEHGQALLGAGRCQLRLHRPQAQSRLEEARTIFASLGARPLLAEVDACLLDAAPQNF